MSVLRITEKVSQEFLTGVGNQLNKELIAQDQKNKRTSYISGKMLYCFSLTLTFGCGCGSRLEHPTSPADHVAVNTSRTVRNDGKPFLL